MKKSLAMVLTILGIGGLIYGVIMLFKGNIGDSNAWIAAVLGLVFFSSGIGLMKSTGSGGGNTAAQ